MKKAVLRFTLSFLLLLSVTPLLVISAIANPIAANPAFPHSPITSLPKINVSAPNNDANFTSPKVMLIFRINEPEDWFEYETTPMPGSIPSGLYPYWGNLVAGNITSVYYVLNGERQNLSVPNIPAFSPTNGSLPMYLSYSMPLYLTSGKYSVQIGVEANDYYLTYYAVTHGGNISTVSLQAVSDEVTFDVSLPQPLILSPENIIYNGSSVPLQFAIGNSPVSWIGYSLDDKANVTVTGNTTLTGLTNGKHYLTVYTNDTLGNSYASQTVNFSVALEKPFLTNTVIRYSSNWDCDCSYDDYLFKRAVHQTTLKAIRHRRTKIGAAVFFKVHDHPCVF